MKKILGVMVALFATVAFGQKWCFVVGGDGRSDGKHVRPDDQNGINVTISKEIVRATLYENAKMLLWTGDLAYGSLKSNEFESMLIGWRDIMEPLYRQKVKVLPVRGNHETFCPESAQIWRKVFSGAYGVPDNGPKGEVGLSYFYEEGSALVVGLDQYAGLREAVNLSWLEKTLTEHKKPFIFSFGHEPAFVAETHHDTLDVHEAERDKLVELLVRAGSKWYFSGHDHLYDHMLAKKGVDGKEFHQFVAGTSGAPFYAPGEYNGRNGSWTLTRLKNIPNTYGYLLVQIEGDSATITFKGRTAPGVYEVMDGPYTYKTTSNLSATR